MNPILSAAVAAMLHLKRQCPHCKRNQVVAAGKRHQTVRCQFCGSSIPPVSSRGHGAGRSLGRHGTTSRPGQTLLSRPGEAAVHDHQRRFPRLPSRSRAPQHGWATKLNETVLPVGAALLLNLLIYEMTGSRALFFLFLLAISLATLLAGWRYGVLATLMSTGAVLFFFVEPRFTLETSHPEEWNKLALFALCGVLAILASKWSGRQRSDPPLGLL